MQLALTTLIGAICMMIPHLKETIRANPWVILLSVFFSFGLLIALHIKRKETPLNFVLLTAFVRSLSRLFD